MKSSQQIAEELAEKAAIEWSHDEGATTSINHYILEAIPLVELIEVARAATWVRPSEQEKTELDKALEKLRATNKIEL